MSDRDAKLKKAWDFVERMATYFDYTHDDVNEIAILHELQAMANEIYGDGELPS